MEKENKTYRAHCLVLAFPAQGHINPSLQFAKRLQHKGVKVTFASTRFIIKTMMRDSYSSSLSVSHISVETISDGFDEAGLDQAESTQAYIDSLCWVGSETLTNVIESLNASSALPVKSIVYDSHLPWCLDIARKFGLIAVPFFTQPCAVNTAYYHAYKGILRLPVNTKIELPGLPPLEPRDMPTFLYDPTSSPATLEFQMNQLSNIDRVDCVLCNTIYELEREVIDWMAMKWPVKAIGPPIPSKYLDKRLPDDVDYDLNLFKPDNDAYMNWLSNKPKGSVVYVSFGSVATPNEEQMTELARGIRRSGCYFLWVVRATEVGKLPKGLVEETKEKGLIVSWCRQLEVLSDEAIGCFITHCGWNSTLEALILGVPMVTIPYWTDESTNAKYISDVWRVGVRPSVDEKGIIRQESIEECIREIMEGDKGKEIKKNTKKWKVLVKQAMEEGGSSDQAINEFVASIVSH